MKDKELKLEDIEVAHTLGRTGEGRVQGEGRAGEGAPPEGEKLPIIVSLPVILYVVYYNR
jgi:hypothetical protein